MVLVADLVLPATKPAPAPDSEVHELGLDLVQELVPANKGSRVAVLEPLMPGADDLVARLKELGVERALDGGLDRVLLGGGLGGGLAELEHQGPGVLVRAVVRRVVGEERGPVEGTIVLGEVHPALALEVRGGLAPQTNSNDVRGGVDEGILLLLQVLEPSALQHPDQQVDGSGRDNDVIRELLPACERDYLGVRVDLGRACLVLDLVRREIFGHSLPDASSPTVDRELEGGVWTPAHIILVGLHRG